MYTFRQKQILLVNSVHFDEQPFLYIDFDIDNSTLIGLVSTTHHSHHLQEQLWPTTTFFWKSKKTASKSNGAGFGLFKFNNLKK